MSVLQQSGIYAITNQSNGKVYIGSAANMSSRWRNHRSLLQRNSHGNSHLQSSWNKYGENAFSFSPLLICAKSDLIMFEQRAINAFDAYKTGYNQRPIANSNAGLKFGPQSVETKAKLRASNLGIKKPALIGNTHTLGLKHSEETKAKIRATNAAREISPETRAKMSLASNGRVQSATTKEKNAAAHRGKKRIFTAEHRANLAIALRKSWATRTGNVVVGNADRDGRDIEKLFD